MLPSPQIVQSSDMGVVALAILCLVFGIGTLTFQILYLRTRDELKHNAPWLFQENFSRSQYIARQKDAKNTASIRSAKGKFAKLGTSNNFSRIPLMKACSIAGFIKKVVIRAIKNFGQLIKRP